MSDTAADLNDMLALQAGDERALDRLMSRHKDALFGFIRGMVRDEEDARELLVETFTRVWTRRETFKAPGLFKPWLYRIAGNLCCDQHRRTVSRLRAFEAWLTEAWRCWIEGGEPADPRPDPAESAATVESWIHIQRAVANLPCQLRAPMVLCGIEQLSQAECAEALGISEKAVETRIYRARRLLKAVLARDGEERFAPNWMPRPAVR